MTDRKQALTNLLAKVEAGTAKSSDFWPSRGAPKGLAGRYSKGWKAFNGSLDAALALHDAILPTGLFSWQIWTDHNGVPTAVIDGMEWSTPECTADTPARAWLIAILRALIAQEEERK